MIDSDVDTALINLRAAVIVMVARKRGMSVVRAEIERMLRNGTDNTEALRRIMSRKEVNSGKRNLFARLLGAFGLRRSV